MTIDEAVAVCPELAPIIRQAKLNVATDGEAAGLYWEHVREEVDGVIEDIKAGHTKDRHGANMKLLRSLEESEYLQDNLAARVLHYSRHACVGLAGAIWPQCGPFPWKKLAQAALQRDGLAELCQRHEFIVLPHYA